MGEDSSPGPRAAPGSCPCRLLAGRLLLWSEPYLQAEPATANRQFVSNVAPRCFEEVRWAGPTEGLADKEGASPLSVVGGETPQDDPVRRP